MVRHSQKMPLGALLSVWPFQVRLEIRHPCLLIWGVWPVRYTPRGPRSMESRTRRVGEEKSMDSIPHRTHGTNPLFFTGSSPAHRPRLSPRTSRSAHCPNSPTVSACPLCAQRLPALPKTTVEIHRRPSLCSTFAHVTQTAGRTPEDKLASSVPHCDNQ